MIKKHSPSAIIILIVILLSACNPKSGPSEITQNFLTALSFQDFETAKSLATKESGQHIETLRSLGAFSEQEDWEIEILREELNGEYAKVYYSQNEGEKENHLKLRNDKEKGWLVIFSKKDMPQIGDGELNMNLENLGEAIEDFQPIADSLSKKVEPFFDNLGKQLEKLGESIEKDLD